MRILVTWGSKRGGTEGIARTIGEVLEREGHAVSLVPAERVRDLGAFDGAVVGGALYAGRWHAAAARFVRRHVTTLRRMPVWLFSSGPLDDSADRQEIPPIEQVAVLMERIGALGHATFGGRLLPDAKGFPASAMAKEYSGDWRNDERIEAWARRVARALPSARPDEAVEPPGRSVGRLVAHGVAGWAGCAAVMGVLLPIAPLWVALTLHAIAAPVIFFFVSRHYFGVRGAREPLATAIAFTAIVVVLDAGVVSGLILHSAAMFASFAGTWLPFLLIFGSTWLTGLSRAWRAVVGEAAPPEEHAEHAS